MAGVPIFYTYDNTTRWMRTIHDSATAATAARTAGTTAVTEGQTEAINLAGETVDAMLAEPRLWHHSDQTPHLREGEYDPYPIRTAIQRWHTRHEYLGGLLTQDWIHAWYPSRDITLGHDILHYLCAGTWQQWRRVRDGDLTAQQFVQWLRTSALGPPDGPRASLTIESTTAGSNIAITLPGAIAWGSDGNGWKLTVRNNTGSPNSISIDKDAGVRSIALNISAINLNAVKDLLEGLADISAADVVITGEGTHGFPIPGSTSLPPVEYTFSGGSYTYDADDPETFFEIASAIPSTDSLRTIVNGLSICNHAPPFNRRELRDMLANPLTGNDFLHAGTPSVSTLNRGRWIETGVTV